MVAVPSNLIPVSITQLPDSLTTSEDVLLVGVYQGNTYKFRAGDLLQVAGVPTSRQVIAGTGLTGGGQLSANITLSIATGGVGTTQLAASGVTPGVYGDATNVPQFTVDATGRVTAATSVPLSISGYVPDTRQVIAGNGLTGGGALSSNVTLAVSYGGSAPASLSGSGSAGSATTVSRSDHSHPAVDLADQAQVDGVLPIDQGGTGRSLTMQPGAVVWSGGDGLYVGTAGVLGQVLVSGGSGAPTWGSTLILTPVGANTFFAGPTSGSDADPVFRTLVNADLPNSGVSANTYGSATQVPALVVNSKGVVTSASAVDVTPAWANITGTPTTIAGYGITDGVTLTGTQTLTNKSISGSTNTLSNIGNASLTNSAITIGSTSVSLGGTITTFTGTSIDGGTNTLTNIGNGSLVNSSISFTYSGGISGSASVALGGTNALSLSNVPNASLANSSVTYNGQTVALGGSGTITAANPYALTIGTGLSGTSYDGSAAVTIANTGVLSNIAGTGISVSGATGNVTITNTAPDQTVTLTAGSGISVSGTYPSFTVANTGVLSFSGGTTGLTPSTATTGAVTLAGTLAVANGGTGATDAANARSNLGAAASGANSDITSLSGITGAISTVNTITFNTAYATTLTAGQMGWDGNNTLGIGMYGGNVVQRVGEDVYFYIKASSAISKGQLVMFTGAVGASGVITGAPATGLTDGQYIMGVASENITLNGFGLVQHFGTVRGFDTTGSSVGETWVDGQILYYNPNYAGGLTNTQPTAPNVKATIAVVTNAGSGGSGSLFVRPSTGSVLGNTDSNVQFGTLNNLDVIQYDSVLQYWKNVPASGLSVSYAATAGSAGSATTATTATNLAGGAASQLPYQTGSGATAFIANGTAGQVLVSAGASAPTWAGISGGAF